MKLTQVIGWPKAPILIIEDFGGQRGDCHHGVVSVAQRGRGQDSSVVEDNGAKLRVQAGAPSSEASAGGAARISAAAEIFDGDTWSRMPPSTGMLAPKGRASLPAMLEEMA